MLTFRPTLEEQKILDSHNVRWTSFCRENIQKLNKDNKQDLWDKIVLRMLLIVLGALIFAFSPLLEDVILVTLEYFVGTTMVLIGTLSMLFLWKGKRARIL